ncbi:ArsR/SmtB family transcription factor [Paucidesulfovibrio longus]|jgi:ArsR family transcriptional regulator|uniref:ArsR/SmtB family transcription factor n=1 Tax=Paucidesulfovibrio longus TaxID=889 RepID=UPI00048818C1|nr:metalloregulator ArsR/SmtB family transcription factor [Paucidesulfovibrio longus]
MNLEEICKALGNPVRLSIMEWLKEPEKNFQPMVHLPENERGKGYVCVGAIQERVGITQSTTSSFLRKMKQVGLLHSKRIGQWTYYRRNEERIQELAIYIANKL